MKKCPQCGREHADHLIVCSSCDVRLQHVGSRYKISDIEKAQFEIEKERAEETKMNEDEEKDKKASMLNEHNDFIKNIDNMSFEDIFLFIEAGLDDECEILKQHWVVEKIVLNMDFDRECKCYLLENLHDYDTEDAAELVKQAEKEIRDLKLWDIKQKISSKAKEMMGIDLSDSVREAISDNVKIFVWQRDQGKCIKCGCRENLEYDHIIPVVKGGSNTERNIQLLCEKCNRMKSDNIA